MTKLERIEAYKKFKQLTGKSSYKGVKFPKGNKTFWNNVLINTRKRRRKMFKTDIKSYFISEQPRRQFKLGSQEHRKYIIGLFKRYFELKDNIQVKLIIDGRYYPLNERTMIILEKIFISGKKFKIMENISLSDAEWVQLFKKMNSFEMVSSNIDLIKHNKTSQGKMFRYTHNIEGMNWGRYGIFEEVDADNYKNNCLYEALKQHNILSDEELTIISMNCKNRAIPICKIKKLAKDFKIHIKIREDRNCRTVNIGDKESERKFKLGLIDEHYFVDDGETNITKYALDNYEDIKDLENWNEIIKKTDKGEYKRSKDKFINSKILFRTLLQNKDKYLTKIYGQDLFKTQFYTKNTEYENLNYCPSNILPIGEGKEDKNNKITWKKYKKKINIKKVRKFISKEFNQTLRYKTVIKFKKSGEFEDFNIIFQEAGIIGELPIILNIKTKVYEKGEIRKIITDEKLTKELEKVLQDVRKIKYEENEKLNQEITDDGYHKVFFDFETMTDYREDMSDEEFSAMTEKHKQFLCCSIDMNDRVRIFKDMQLNITDKKTKEKKKINLDSGKLLLNSLTEDTMLIAHNLGYDIRFLIKHLHGVDLMVDGKTVRGGTAFYKNFKTNKTIKLKFKDSYQLISMPLRKFSDCFKIKLDLYKYLPYEAYENKGELVTVKEVMPYKLYNQETVNKETVYIRDAIEVLKAQYKDPNQYNKIINQFLKNIEDWELSEDNESFDHIQYSINYCILDCVILKKGYETFKDWMKESTKGLSIDDYISLPSIVHAFFIQEGCYNGVYKLSGVPRDFIQKCLVGGRCMTRDNQKHHIIQRLQDFDAVSLYPSAVVRLQGFLKGIPKIIETKNFEEIKDYDGYFIEVNIKNIPRRRHFPLISKKNEDGIRDFDNNIRGNIFIDKIAMEDLIKYHELSTDDFEIIRGYYFNDGYNPKVKEVMRGLFNTRLQKKKEKNPIQMVYKLMMNSSYGKSIMKPIETETKFIYGMEETEKYVAKNHNHIKSYTKMDVCDKYIIETIKPIDEHFSIPQVGISILSMSKRIMNEVMVLAEDMNIKIYYQDTDSMHIPEEDIPRLAKEYQKVYDRQLIGKNMGQFHSDFDFKCDEGTEPVSIESYFLAKKIYIDKIELIKDGKKEIDYHIRMKGVPGKSVLAYDENPMKTYEKLFKGETVEFDLMKAKDVIFEFCKDFSIINRVEFKRKININSFEEKNFKRVMKELKNKK